MLSLNSGRAVLVVSALFVSVFLMHPVAAQTRRASAEPPLFSLAAGEYSERQTVGLRTSVAGATIRYTLDGTTPSTSSGIVYTQPFDIGATTTVTAVAYAAGLTESAAITATYTISAASSHPNPFQQLGANNWF